MEEKIENGRVVDGFDFFFSPIVSGSMLNGFLSLNCSGGGSAISIGRMV